MATASTPKVYETIAAVTADIGKEGIAKDRSNQQQGYKFRGIDDVYNVLSPIIAKHKLCILPRILSREVTERQTAKGNALFYVVVEAEFDFVCAEDGSKHTVRTYGEAMDSADKATNKAMSAAYKYAAMQTFCIPTEGDNDADSQTHDVAPTTKPAPMSKEKAKEVHDEVASALQTAGSVEALTVMWKNWQPEIKSLPTQWQTALTQYAGELKTDLIAKQEADPFGFDQLDEPVR